MTVSRQKTRLPSSGQPWTDEEDELLARQVIAIWRQWPTRSLAAVVTRIGRLALKYYHAGWPGEDDPQ